MPVQFGGAPVNKPAATPPAQTPGTLAQQPAGGPTPGAKPPAQMKPGGPTGPGTQPKFGFLMQGQQAQAALAEEEAKAALAQAESGKLWRFFISQKQVGVEYPITFLDGDLDAEGMLQMVSWYEHSFMLGGRVQHFVCTAQNEPCPMCSGGSDRNLMFGFTVIDMTPYTIQKGDKEGQVIPWSRKLYVCKKKTATQLQMIAGKLGGLRGANLTVTRSGNMSPNTGDVFFPVARYSPEELVAEFGDKSEPANWMEELTYRTADELVQLGVAEAVQTVTQSGMGKAKSFGSSKNFTDQF